MRQLSPTGSAQTRWRGFNLTHMMSLRSGGNFTRDDLSLIRDWGFNFVRVPLNYRKWIVGDDIFSANEGWLAIIDKVVEAAHAANLHLSLSFHRAPGFTVSREGPEPLNLWRDVQAQQAFLFHWTTLARRYSGIGGEDLSFNLINEPPAVSPQMSRLDHENIIRIGAHRIKEIDADRTIVIDGIGWGREPLFEMLDLKAVQSCRAYEPMSLTHHLTQSPWSRDDLPPTWPYGVSDQHRWDRPRLELHYAPWRQLMRAGVTVHCGEIGCSNSTSHAVALAWFRDVLEVLGDANIGWALWNLRGPFGVLDSGRNDVSYEATSVGLLDRRLLDLLRSH